MNEVAISVEELVKIYKLYEKPIDRLKESLSITKHKYHTEYYALNNISLEIKKGETIAIIGINGAGKSTLLKILTGVLSSTKGKVVVNGNISALLELGTGFNPEYTGIENIYLNGTMRGFNREDIDQKLKSIVEFADIGDFIYQPVKTYSSGMFARLAFAVAINVEPEILIVDEALSVGDIFFQQKCNQYMKENMSNITKILVTHDMATVANMADRVVLLEKGKKVFDGEPSQGIEYYLKQVHNDLFKKDYKKSEVTDIIVGSKDECFVQIEEDKLGGAGQVKAKSFLIRVNGTDGNIVKNKDSVEIIFEFVSYKDIKNLIIGYVFKDKYGNSILGRNTISQGIRIENIKKQCVYQARMEIIWPQVKEGDYFLTLGIGEGEDEMVHTIQCWAHNIVAFQAIADIPMHGIINNNIDKFTIKERV